MSSTARAREGMCAAAAWEIACRDWGFLRQRVPRWAQDVYLDGDKGGDICNGGVCSAD